MENLQSLRLQYQDLFELDSDESWPGSEQDGVSTPIRSLGDLVGDLPTSVHTLEIRYSPFKCDENHGRTFLVKKLTLVGTCLFGEIGPLLANHFPHRHSLTLEKVFEKSTTLTLSNHHFSCLRFVDNRGGSSTFTLCLATSGGASHRYYTVGSNINGKDMVYNPLPSDTPMHHKVVTIICGSVKKLFLNGIEANLNIPNAEMGK
jgi:hypothetical protein